MNIYDAIMRAADHIEQHPTDFLFSAPYIPNGCGMPGCALGWISHFMGMTGIYDKALQKVAGTYMATAFYADLTRLEGETRGWNYGKWMGNPKLCSQVLRLYAAKYHAPALRPTSALVADLMVKVMGERIAEEA